MIDRRVVRAWTMPPLALLLACSGNISQSPSWDEGAGAKTGASGGSGSRGATSSATSGRPGDPNSDPRGESATGTGAAKPITEYAPTRMRRLTVREIKNTLSDVLMGGQPLDVDVIGEQPSRHTFDNGYDALSVPTELAASLQQLAETAAARAVMSLPAASACEPQKSGESACAAQVITRVGRKLWRRPLTSTEQTRMLTLFTSTRAKEDYATSVATVLEALVQSPWFLFRPELGGRPVRGTIVGLTPHETATALSYTLWGSAPDDELLDAADDNALVTRAQLEAQVTRMLEDPRAKRGVTAFLNQLFELTDAPQLGAEKSKSEFPTFDARVAASMLEETRRFIEQSVWSGDGSFGTLLTSTATFADANVARLYGLTGGGASFAPVQVDAKTRAGLLTQPSFLASIAPASSFSPVRFGRFVKVKLFCEPLPPPPNVVPPLQPASTTTTTRARFAQHSKDAACSGCHQLFEPMGWGFELFSAVGEYRTIENGAALSGDGEVKGTDIDGKFTGAVGLASKLVTSRQAAACMAAQALQFALGRDTASPDSQLEVDRATISSVTGDATLANLKLKDVLRRIATSEAFLTRDAANLSVGGKI